MNLKEFQYLAPSSLLEAISSATEYGSKVALLAGGTDLIVQMKHGEMHPSYVINLKRIPDLDKISYSSEEGLSIGPLVTHNTLVKHPFIIEKCRVLAEAADQIGTFQIRELGTIGGNICTGSPAADMIPSLICLGAKLKLQSSKGDRLVAIEDFFQGPQKTRRESIEILTQIQIPTLPSSNTCAVYLKHGIRKALEIAIVGVGALITLDNNKTTCLEARIALASVAPVPLRCYKAEEVLVGQEINIRNIEKAAQIAQSEATPISDLRSTAEYRSEMVYILTKKVLNKAWHRALVQDA
jgi:carbon-monoxide dehydrogenase medium subunit